MRRGLASVTVDDICLAAGVSKGGFYHHFADKERVFSEVALEDLVSELKLAAATQPDSSQRPSASGLLVDLGAWGPRRSLVRRHVQALHGKALSRLFRISSGKNRRDPREGDGEARAVLALAVGVGRLVERGMSGLRRDTGETARGSARSA